MTAGHGKFFAALGAIVLGCATVPDAGAFELPREAHQKATGVCQAALPAFEGQIRKRPLAVQNEGSANAFVSCSLFSPGAPATSFLHGAIYAVILTLDNDRPDPVDVTCTLVVGASRSPWTRYFPRTVTLPANSTYNQIAWSQDPDFDGGMVNPSPGISCNLEPGVGIADTTVYYNEEIGS